MSIQIQVLSVQIETKPTAKGSYQQAEVAYKNLTFQGKVEAKKLMSFGAQKDTFTVLATASPGSVYEVEVVKNAQGYNDWVKISKSEGNTNSVPTAAAPSRATNATSTPSKAGGWETPEERAKKQIYIVRQSSLSAAVATLTVGRKTELKPEEVIGLASKYEAFVFGADSVEEVVSRDVGGIESLNEDLPF